VNCNEVHHPGTGKVPSVAGATTLNGYDNATCVLVTPQPGLAGFTLTDVGWNSDFTGDPGVANLVVDSTGTSYHVVAWYPNC
jgi:hypothetical protein